jgi:hypothetical protein
MTPPVQPEPNATTTPPTSAPIMTSPNGTESDVQLSPYYVFYTIEQTRIPTLADTQGLANFTDDYVNTFLGEIFTATNDVEFVTATTEATGSQFRLGEPVRVDFTTTVSFAPASARIPPSTELDEMVRSIFEGENAATYVGAIGASLDSSNIFSTTSAVRYEVAARDSTARVGISAGAASAIVVLMIAGVSWYRRRGYSLVETNKTALEYMTVGDDTFVGEDSISQSPAKYRFDGEKSQDDSSVDWVIYPHDGNRTAGNNVSDCDMDGEGEPEVFRNYSLAVSNDEEGPKREHDAQQRNFAPVECD